MPFLSIYAQEAYYISPYVWQDMQKVQLDNPLSFIDYPYESPYLDMRDFQMHFPELHGRVPEYVQVVPPPDVNRSELFYSLAYISSADGSTGVLVIFFIDRYYSDHPRLWVDANLNRDFTDDAGPIEFKKPRQRVDIRLKHDSEKALAFYFSIIGPELEKSTTDRFAKEPQLSEPESSIKRKNAFRIPPWLSFNFDVGYALGRVRYQYQDLTTGYPTTYSVTSNHKGFRAGLGVHLKSFRISATAGFNHFFYWTSYKTVRLGEPFYFCNPQCVRFENVEELRNRDIQPKVRWDFGTQLSWEPHITNEIRLGPFIEPQIWVYSGGNYYEKVVKEYNAFKFGPDPAVRTGLSFWVKAGPQAYFRMELSASWSRFQPEGFFDGVNLVDDQQRSFGLNLGYGF